METEFFIKFHIISLESFCILVSLAIMILKKVWGITDRRSDYGFFSFWKELFLFRELHLLNVDLIFFENYSALLIILVLYGQFVYRTNKLQRSLPFFPTVLFILLLITICVILGSILSTEYGEVPPIYNCIWFYLDSYCISMVIGIFEWIRNRNHSDSDDYF